MSQELTMLKLLRKAGKHGVPNYKFPQHNILRYSARFGDLRKEGFNITAVRQMHHGRFTGVWNYILNEEDK